MSSSFAFFRPRDGPWNMDMELMDMYQRPYSNLDMQAYNGPQYGQPHGQQYPVWNHQHHLMALYQQHQQRAAAVMMGQGSMHASKQTEPKPRLAKDEVELLEREFAKNPKPNSSTKRELAEQMGVEVPRINVRLSRFCWLCSDGANVNDRTGSKTEERRRSR